MVELIAVTDEEIRCLAVEQYGISADTLNGDGSIGWRHGGGNGLQVNLEIGDLPAGDGDGPSYGRVAVVDQFHLVLARTQLQFAMLAGFAHHMVLEEDISSRWRGLNGAIDVLTKA